MHTVAKWREECCCEGTGRILLIIPYNFNESNWIGYHWNLSGFVEQIIYILHGIFLNPNFANHNFFNQI